MISIVSYIHTCYIRSYRYAPPTVAYIAFIFILYSIVPNPVMESYAFTSTVLFIIAAVTAYFVMDNERENQEAISIMHTGSIVKLYTGKLLYSWLFTLPLALFAVLYPALTTKFYRPATIEELIAATLSHMSVSWLAVSLACWFCSKIIYSRLHAFLLLSLVIVITLSVEGLKQMLPVRWQPVIEVMPPHNKNMQLLSNYDAASISDIVIGIGYPFLYGTLAIFLFLFIVHKRKMNASALS